MTIWFSIFISSTFAMIRRKLWFLLLRIDMHHKQGKRNSRAAELLSGMHFKRRGCWRGGYIAKIAFLYFVKWQGAHMPGLILRYSPDVKWSPWFSELERMNANYSFQILRRRRDESFPAFRRKT